MKRKWSILNPADSAQKIACQDYLKTFRMSTEEERFITYFEKDY